MTTLDLQQLPWLVVIGDGSTLELRDLVVTNIAPRRLAFNTSYFYAGGLFAWPSLTAQPGGALNSYNTQLFFWSSSRFRRGDCDWLHAGPARDEADQVNLAFQEQLTSACPWLRRCSRLERRKPSLGQPGTALRRASVASRETG